MLDAFQCALDVFNTFNDKTNDTGATNATNEINEINGNHETNATNETNAGQPEPMPVGWATGTKAGPADETNASNGSNILCISE